MAKQQVWFTPEQVELVSEVLRYAQRHADARVDEKYSQPIDKLCDAYCSRRITDVLMLLEPQDDESVSPPENVEGK
jgi:hypothetical protein